MSNALAVAAVSEVLRSIVESAAQTVVGAATAATGRPETVDPGEEAAAVGVFLYQVTPNPSWRNQELPTRRGDGSTARRPQTALDLHYLLTFFGDEVDQEPERMMGAVVSSLYSAPTLTRERIRQVLPATHELGGTGLDRQVDLVRFVPSPLTIDEMSKLWGMFVQTPYRLSVAYHGAVVLIEPEETAAPSLPVRRRNVYVELLERPILDQVSGEDGPDALVVFGGELVLRGQRLAGDQVRVLVRHGDAEVEAVPDPGDVGGAEIRVALDEPPFPAGSLRAGIAGVRVIHRRLMGEPGAETPHRGVESNLMAFVLRPRIAAGAGLDGLAVTTENAVPPPPPPPPVPAPPAEPVVVVAVEPAVGADQEAVLLLNRSGESHAIPAWRRAADTDPLRFPVTGVSAGTYRVRVRVDGAESLLETDDEGLYVRPRVTLP
jgi:hypothetical protein